MSYGWSLRWQDGMTGTTRQGTAGDLHADQKHNAVVTSARVSYVSHQAKCRCGWRGPGRCGESGEAFDALMAIEDATRHNAEHAHNETATGATE
jgi:hypothetical protein